MARPYSEKFLRELQNADDRQMGVQLARLCVDAGIPATYIAVALESTRMTVYSWFRGQDIRRKKRREVEVLIDLMRKDFKKGTLPVETHEEAKGYVEDLIGMPLPPPKPKKVKEVAELV
jgi:hypothetical protein